MFTLEYLKLLRRTARTSCRGCLESQPVCQPEQVRGCVRERSPGFIHLSEGGLVPGEVDTKSPFVDTPTLLHFGYRANY